jgi:hypothetical protein
MPIGSKLGCQEASNRNAQTGKAPDSHLEGKISPAKTPKEADTGTYAKTASGELM